jgi:hypothetical protein
MPQTTSFELSKQLFEVAKSKRVELPDSMHIWELDPDFSLPELWFKTTSNFYIEMGEMGGKPSIYSQESFFSEAYGEFYKSYTTDELLAWLPHFIKKDGCFYFLILEKIDSDNYTTNYNSATPTIKKLVHIKHNLSDTPSNTLAKLAIYLLKNNLLK